MMLLIMSMEYQLIHWPENFCRELAKAKRAGESTRTRDDGA